MKKRTSNFKKFSTQLILIIFFGLVYLLPFYRNEFYVSHDGQPQVARSAAVYKAFADGQLPPRWAGDLNYSYGIPSPNFFFPMMGYLISTLYFFGLSLETSYKVVMAAAFILSGLTFYLWLSGKIKKKAAFGSAFL